MTKKYTLIYADPPWVYRDKAADGNRGAGFKYPVMSVLDICRLPVWDLADENCLLAMWWVPTQPLEALKVVEAWGFRLMTMKGFTWIKCGSRQPDKLVMGMGHMTRANSEDCLFAVKGKLPTRINAGIVQSFTAPRLEHSRKPDIVREKLVQLLGDVSRIELFPRHPLLKLRRGERNQIRMLPVNPGINHIGPLLQHVGTLSGVFRFVIYGAHTFLLMCQSLFNPV